MSSYIIDKADYIKIGGILFGIEEAKPRMERNDNFLKGLYQKMCDCHKYNVISYCEQYDITDIENYLDERDFKYIFDEYAVKGKKWYKAQPIQVLESVYRFFRSALYQTDNEEYADKMKAIFFDCLDIVVRKPKIGDWWGSVNIPDNFEELI